MYLDFAMLRMIFPKVLGLNDDELMFQSIAVTGGVKQPKGLFIPLLENRDDLLQAINNGAIAAVWDENWAVPAFKPNHFPLFLTKNMDSDIEKLLYLYQEKVTQEEDVKQMSNLVDVELLKEKILTYDNSNQFKQIIQRMEALAVSRRG